MVNTVEFTKRLNQIMEYYDLSAAGFADRINVGRSSISHLLSGRNKPSLDFVMKVIQTFPEVELYWLLNGKGTFPGSTKDYQEPMGAKEELDTSSSRTTQDLFSQEEEKLSKDEFKSNLSSPKSKTIKKIVIFYDDSSFEAFENWYTPENSVSLQ